MSSSTAPARTARVARDLCSHRGAALSRGWVEDDTIVCPYHGFHYAPDGRCTLVPAHPDLPISPKLRIVTFPTVERFGLIWCTLNGHDESLPEFEAWDDPEFQPILAPTIDINGSAGRQVEGFLDVAHFAWAHTESFGEGAEPDRAHLQSRAHRARHSRGVCERREQLSARLPASGAAGLSCGCACSRSIRRSRRA